MTDAPLLIYTHEILSLDVWGNETDGFEVNQSFTTGIEFAFFEDISDEKLIEVVGELLSLDKSYFNSENVEVGSDSDHEFGLYFYDKKTSKPLVFTRRVKEGG